MPRGVRFAQYLAYTVVPVVNALNTSLDVDAGFVRDQCYARTLKYLADGTLAPDDIVFFRDTTTGRPMSNPSTLTLTLSGCLRLCGPKRQWYSDIGSRLSVWLIPSLLLISNIELSPLDKRRFFAIIHLLGDPIDSFGSLVDKVASWDHCYRLAAQQGYCRRCTRAVATVYAGFEDLEGARIFTDFSRVGPDPEGQEASQIKPQSYLDRLAVRHKLEARFPEWRRTALELANSRSDELLRTGLAIVVYVYQLIGGFVKQVGGEPSSPPGGRIATGVLLSWLLPTILLSNLIGNFPSRYTVSEILARFAAKTGGLLDEPDRESIFLQRVPALKRRSLDPSIEALSWAGGIYTFRPWRHCNTGPRKGWPRMTLIQLLSITPVFVSITGACLILWNLIPNGFNCRHTWVIAVFFAWLASAFITWVSYTPRFATGKYHWRFILAKDLLVGVPSVIIMFLSACGLFNNCKCWSGYLYYRHSARVAMNTHPFFEHNDSTLYQYIVWSCLGMQGVLFVVIAIKWRRGLQVFRWSEKTRREERKRMMASCTCTCMGVEESSDTPAIENKVPASHVEPMAVGETRESDTEYEDMQRAQIALPHPTYRPQEG